MKSRDTTLDTKRVSAQSIPLLCTMSEIMYLQILPFDVTFFYRVLLETVAYVKKVNPTMTKTHYFLDGCALQNKNCKHFLNLCHHKNVFGTFLQQAKVSHCVGICGAVKRLTAQASSY